MSIFALCGVAVIAAILCLTIKQYSAEAAVWTSVGCGVLLLLAVIRMLSPAVDTLRNISETAGISGEYVQVLLKALVICYLTKFSSDMCRDAGETAIATKLEFAGRIAVVVLSLPLYIALVDIVTGLMSW